MKSGLLAGRMTPALRAKRSRSAARQAACGDAYRGIGAATFDYPQRTAGVV
jgi:hypothetical protein